MTEKYEHRLQFVEGPFESNMEMKCIGGGKDPFFQLCFRNADGIGWFVPFADMRLFSKDLYIEAKAVEKDTKALGDEISRRWNALRGEWTTIHPGNVGWYWAIINFCGIRQTLPVYIDEERDLETGKLDYYQVYLNGEKYDDVDNIERWFPIEIPDLKE